MERDAHYFVVGLFVIAMAVAGFLFAGLFYDDKAGRDFVSYDIHFDTPVDGLERGSEIRYMGIKVGEVTQVFLLPGGDARVGVRVRVEDYTPVNSATIATLRQQGLTGLPFINLTQNDKVGKPQPLVAAEGQALPVIFTEPSELDALVQKLPDLEKNLTVLLNSASEVLNKENRENVASLLKNLNTAVAGIPPLVSGLQQTSIQLGRLVDTTNKAVSHSEQGINASMKEFQTTLGAIRNTSQKLDTLLKDVDRVVVNNEGQVNELLGEGGENLRQLLNESRKTAVSIRQLSDRLGQNPSQIIYQPAPQGTELPR
jgi:phospholipid/cholesterol/gamma-HCH transport system substrate-binding protein